MTTSEGVTHTYVDRGGTFTDVVALGPSGRVSWRKVRSDQAVIGRLAEGALSFGTTVATNALLERQGVRTLLVVSEGFHDLVMIGDQCRPDLFDPDATRQPPLCTGILEVHGRLSADGEELEALSLETLPTSALEGYQSYAVVLLHSHRSGAHERAVGQWIHAHMGESVPVSLGHHVSPSLGYLARIETTLVDAAITPILKLAMQADEIAPTALAIRSDGSLCPAHQLGAPDAILSGPAGGVLAVSAVAQQAGFTRAVGLDMGGTSTDVCRIDVGHLPRRQGHVEVAGVRVSRPMLEVETIAAGGGSVLTNDGLRLKVGPRSAGANPGPQCYGRGGPPTLTDAALRLGLLQPDAFQPPLDAEAIKLPGEAKEFVEIAREAMAQAVRKIATRRGVDLRDHAMVCYGGAAGQHVASVARRLEIRHVLVHPCAAVLSAWGQSLARREEHATCSLWMSLDEAAPQLIPHFERLESELPDWPIRRREVSLRYAGTDHSLTVSCQDEEGCTTAALVAAFEVQHEAQFGFIRPELAIEVVDLSARALAPPAMVPRIEEDPFELGGAVIEGPCLLSCPTTSVWVPEGWRAKFADGLLKLDDLKPTQRRPPEVRSPFSVELWSSRFQSVAEDAGTVLERLARSVNIRERRDFSVALFDGHGRLVANAPHVPVHLGAMGETVRDLITHQEETPHLHAWLTNAPDAGGSHLPDLTVVTAVWADGHRWFVASRGHHVDVGGTSPGSMPPRASRLLEEGVVFRRVPLLGMDGLADLTPWLKETRQPQTVLADLQAQLAANHHAAQALMALGPAALISTWMGHLRDVARESVERLIPRLELGQAEEALDTTWLACDLSRRGSMLHVDFSGCGPPHPGNLNAPSAVLRAAVLYALRVLVGETIPLNEGALDAVTLTVAEGTVVSPPSGRAVAGGNVETSQRLVDLMFRACGERAASQGTMNNLTLGGDLGDRRWSLYETIGGGTGASRHREGASAQQVHMTNTRATDPEVLETRLPLLLRSFSIRHGSGGGGLYKGGDGLIRELEVRGSAQVALLASRRRGGAPGLNGGHHGSPAVDQLRIAGQWGPWDGSSAVLERGDRVRIETPGGGGYGQEET